MEKNVIRQEIFIAINNENITTFNKSLQFILIFMKHRQKTHRKLIH